MGVVPGGAGGRARLAGSPGRKPAGAGPALDFALALALALALSLSLALAPRGVGPMLGGMNVVLIGYRGSGKTSIGRALADRLGVGFIDTDAEVVERFGGLSIAEVWRRWGEPAFRLAERQVIDRLLADDGRVLAFGGGAVMQPAVRAALDAAGARCTVIYLRARASTLGARIAADAATAEARPSLSGLAGSADEVADVLAAREPTYRAVADHVIDVDDRTVEALAEAAASLCHAR